MIKNYISFKSGSLYYSISLSESRISKLQVVAIYRSQLYIAGLKTYTILQRISDDLSLKRAILNFVKCVAQDELPDIQLNNYRLLLDFLQGYDPSIYITPQNFAYYKRVEGKLEIYRLNSKVSSFIEYVKDMYPDFLEEWIRHDARTYIAENDPDSAYSKLKPAIKSGNKSTTGAFKHTRQNSNRNFSTLAYTHKRSYSISHRIQLLIIKSELGYRYMTTLTYQDIRRIKIADVMFDRSDSFLKTLDKQHELVPIMAPNIQRIKSPKERAELKKSIYGLHKWVVKNSLSVRGVFDTISKDRNLIKKAIKFLASLEKDVIYRALVLNIRDSNRFGFADNSFYISRNTNPQFIVTLFLFQTSVIVTKYGLSEDEVHCILSYKK
jgi:hypothetical protein